MDYQETIELLKGEIKCSCYRNRGYCGICTIYSELDRDKIIDACKCAISAIQELKMYKDGKLCLIPEDVFKNQCEELDAYKEIGTLEEFQLLKATHLTGVELVKISCALKQLEKYKQLGTLEEVREAVEKHKWIPCSERLPEDGDNRFYMCVVENHEEDPPMFCQYEEEYGFGFWHDIYDEHTLGFVDSEFKTNEELGYERVIAWMPLPEPYRPDKCHGCFGAANNDCERCMDGNEK